ncbi:hypothetical protein Pla175_34690 [Pirellulimonas nuda]|uniref:Putative restriction endonuclease domain-containing protein n=1 Tax=Pirellulimonas nuda TaxID=2528009 RepID=A0A518DF07_9BACT|nr:Uma2 family endonuclease [Pirellulimonas nuda]QDU90069.1 hypothetical protein Pla175_34690 [Pirellulimonas nuda]
MSPAEVSTITAEEMLSMPESEGCELVDGQLLEKNLGAKSGWIGGRLLSLLDRYSDDGRNGWAFPSECGIQCIPNEPNRVLKPDAFFLRPSRLPGEQIPDGWVRVAPDLAAEVVSPNDLYSDVEQKVEEYLEAGVKLVWVIDPVTRTAMVYRPRGAQPSRLSIDGELSGEDVLPGFKCQVAALFPEAQR